MSYPINLTYFRLKSILMLAEEEAQTTGDEQVKYALC